MRKSRPKWDRHAIKAAVHRAGKTLTALATESGLEPSACRAALLRPNRNGEHAIAQFLGVAPGELWPERYGALTSPQHSSTAARGGPASPNHKAA